MNKFTCLLACSALLLTSTVVSAQNTDAFPGLETLMTAKEYQAAGIAKLSAEERKALNRWLVRFTAEDSEVLRNTDAAVIEAAYEQDTLSSIEPPFKGWSGDTIFKLANGQVWQQRRRGNFAFPGGSTEVRITKNFMGFYRMEMTASGKSVQVVRLR